MVIISLKAAIILCKEKEMKRKTAKEILAESFHELAIIKPIDKITVQNIVDNCGYSPATFYRNFRDKYDMIAWLHSRGVAEVMNKLDKNIHSWVQTLKDAANWFYDEKEYLMNLFSNTSGYDSFMRHIIEIHYAALEKYILSVNKKRELEVKEKLLLRTYCIGTLGVAGEWVSGRYTVTKEEIVNVWEAALPKELEKYFVES